MNKKILASFIIFIMWISSGSYALEYAVPVWNESGMVKEVSNEVRRVENEYAEVAEGQFQKNQEFKSDDIAFYENELALAENGLTTYAKTLGLTDEQINLLLNEATDDLNIVKLDEEAMANDILEGALREFGDCARGEL